MTTEIILMVAGAYLLGSIPFSFILGKVLKGIDLREYGSRNVGATNALRVLGWKTGLLALILDMLKGYGAILIARSLAPQSNILLISVGFAAILGHIFTIFLRFKGGKGVATSAGVFAALMPVSFIVALLSFLIITVITRYVSLGSLVAAVMLLIMQTLITLQDGFYNAEYLILVIIVALFIIIKHIPNINRLIDGTENKVSFRRKKD